MPTRLSRHMVAILSMSKSELGKRYGDHASIATWNGPIVQGDTMGLSGNPQRRHAPHEAELIYS